MMPPLHKAMKLLAAILLCQLAGVVGSVFIVPAMATWYAGLHKPYFAPPDWVFSPTWIILYALMGISLYLILESSNKPKLHKPALYAFGAQLFMNAAWSFLFFGLHSPLAGLIGIVILWPLILLTMLFFNRINKPAAYLLAPYIIWVSIAAGLNLSVWMLN